MQAAARGHAARAAAAAAAAATAEESTHGATQATEAAEEQGGAKAAAKPGLLERLASFSKTMSWSNKSIPPEEVVEAAEPKVEAELEVKAEAEHHVEGALLTIFLYRCQSFLAWPPGAQAP